MQKIRFNGQEYECQEKDTVLDVLLKHGIDIPHSCRSGVCHTCLLKASKGRPTDQSQAGLKETLVKQKYFLGCQCIPENYLEIVLPGDDVRKYISAEVIDKTPLSDSIMRLRLKPEEAFEYHAGQFINIYRNDGLIRSYSLASVPELDDHLEIHVQNVPNGQMSNWVHNKLDVGEVITISEAEGQCFYLPGHEQENLLLIGTGSGLAPLFGILRDALNQGHEGDVWLYHGSSTRAGLYLQDELRKIASTYDNIHYSACVSREEGDQNIVKARANELALQQHSDLKGWRIYLCGNPEMVEASKRAVFLGGASLKDIFADAFLYAK
jgi:ferredoxin-NADP reductase/ferredoxin